MDNDDRFVDINIRKPVYGNFCYIRDKYIKQAKVQRKWLRITTPNGIGYCSPDWWQGTGKRLAKEFKIPGSPMILYGNHVPIDVTL